MFWIAFELFKLKMVVLLTRLSLRVTKYTALKIFGFPKSGNRSVLVTPNATNRVNFQSELHNETEHQAYQVIVLKNCRSAKSRSKSMGTSPW